MNRDDNNEVVKRLRAEKMQLFGSVQEDLYKLDLDGLRKLQAVFEKEAVARLHSVSINDNKELQEIASYIKGANQFLNWLNNCKIILNKTMEG